MACMKALALALTTLLGLAACSYDSSITDGKIVDKQYYSGCSVREIMGTASGPLAYDRTVDPAYTVTVEYGDTDVDGKPVRRTSTIVVSEKNYATYEVGQEFSTDYAYWFRDECEDEREQD